MVSQNDSVSPAVDPSSSASPVSERKRAANRANAGKSTGPRTEAGKSRSRLNATRHGLRAELPPDRFFVLGVVDDEDPHAYRRLRSAFRADLRPRGAAEAFLVERLALTAWRLRRAEAVETQMLDAAEIARYEGHERCRSFATMFPGKLPPETERAGEYEFRTLEKAEAAQFAARDGKEPPMLRLAAYQARLEGQFRASLRELRSLRKERVNWDDDDAWDEDEARAERAEASTVAGAANAVEEPPAPPQTDAPAAVATNEPTASPTPIAAPTNEATAADDEASPQSPAASADTANLRGRRASADAARPTDWRPGRQDSDRAEKPAFDPADSPRARKGDRRD